MNIALMISSFKRWNDLYKQISAMLAQTYKADIFVAVKGITEYQVNTCILPMFQSYVDSGRLTIRHFPNTNQITNLLDTIRDTEWEKYDLFFKIDDDDFYSSSYVEEIASIYENHGKNESGEYMASMFTGRGDSKMSLTKKTNKLGYPIISPSVQWALGMSLVLTKEVMSHLFRVEEDSNYIEKFAFREIWKVKTFGFCEDAMAQQIAKETCGLFDRREYMQEGKTAIFISEDNSSVCRGGLYDGIDFYKTNMNTDAKEYEHVFTAHKQGWGDPENSVILKLYKGNVVKLTLGGIGGRGKGTWIRENEELEVNWEGWGKEVFVRQEDGRWLGKA